MNIKYYVNEEFDEEKALVEIKEDGTEQLIMKGDYYHDKIDQRMEGFLEALDYLEIEYSGNEEVKINHGHEKFDVLNFTQEWCDEDLE